MQSNEILMQDKNAKTIQNVGNVLLHGAKAVTTAGTRVALIDTTTKTLCLIIKANNANTGSIYVGDNDVASTNGYVLLKNETITLWIDNSKDPVYIDSSVNGEGVTYAGWSAE